MSVNGLTSEERSTVSRLWERGVLVNINQEKLRAFASQGTILYYCGDCDQAPEFRRHFESILPPNCRIHVKSEDGGALRLNPRVPIPSKMRIDSQAQYGLTVSRQMKRIPALTLQSHYPCGMAELTSLTLPDVIWHLIETPAFISQKVSWDPALMMTLFHVDYGDRRKTYFAQAKNREEVYL